jgi:hypothetical protein
VLADVVDLRLLGFSDTKTYDAESMRRAQAASPVMPNVRAKLPAEAGAVSPGCDDAPCAADQAYSACRSGSA